MINKTLIDGLYEKLKENLKVCRNRDYIIDLVFPFYGDYSGRKTSLSRPEIYNEACENDFRNYSAYILDEDRVLESVEKKTLEVIRKNALEAFVKTCISELYIGKLKEALIDLLNTTNIHNERILCEKLIVYIQKLQVLKKVDNDLEQRWFDEWVETLYYYFYFAVTDKLHSNIAFSAYPELGRDLDEYNNKITLMYGVSGNPGMYQLYSMAERDEPNIIALYECGELEYYGKGPSGKVNYQKAYEFYEKTMECNAEHPLATWSIAYMMFHYSKEKADKNPEYRVQEFEEELCNGKKRSWYESILLNVQSSYNYGCAAAANLLGKIVDASDEEFPISRRGMYKNKSAKELYKESADGGYVYGCNNYASKCIKEANAITDTKKISEKKELLREAIYYLEKSACLGNPWAANKMGTYYVEGFSVDEEVLVEKNVERAYRLFEYACVMVHAENYFWPLINICNYFWLNKESEKYLIVPKERIIKELKEALICIDDNSQIEKIKDLLIRTID